MSKKNRVHKLFFWLFISSLLVLLAVEFLSLSRWILYPFCPSISYEDSSWWPVHLETNLFYLPASLAPFVLAITLFLWIMIPLRRYLRIVRARVRIGERVITLWDERKSSSERLAKPEMFGLKFSVLALACSIGFASVFAVYPYLPSLNPDGKHVGIDLSDYEEWLFEMSKGDWLEAGAYAFFSHRDRPLSVLLIFGGHQITSFSPRTTLKFMPLLLGPSLIVAAFYFLLEATENWTVSSIAALLAALSYPVTVGVLGALFSNWMALVMVFLFSGLMMRSMRERSWWWAIFAGLAMVFVLFMHSYTWGMLIGVLGIYGLLLVVLGVRGEKVWWKLKVVSVIVIVNVVTDVVRNWLLGSVGVAREVVSEAGSKLALEFLGQFWSGLNWALQEPMGGFYMNFVVLFLALIGAFFICLRDEPVHRYLTSWLMLSSVLFILGSSTAKWRILYNLPVTIFAAIGLYYVSRRLRSLEIRHARVLESLCILLVVLINVNYGFRCAHYLLEAFVFA